MKIAISGSQDIGKEKLIKSFIENWPMYTVITDKPYENIEYKYKVDFYNKVLENMEQEYNKYSSNEHILFYWSPIDVFCNAIVDNFDKTVNDAQLEAILKKGKKILSLLDANFIITQYEPEDWDNIVKNVSNESAAKIAQVNLMYGNILHEYYTEFDADVFFPKDDCPGIVPLETENYILELQGLINNDGDQYSEEANKKLNEVMMTLAQDTIEKRREQERKNLLEVQERLLGEEQAKKLRL